MKSVLRCYNHICNQKYRSHGFAKSKQTFARIRGDILHAFTLKASPNEPICTVDFGIFPLCMPEPLFIEAGGYVLDAFQVEQHTINSGWKYDPNSYESVVDCIDAISQALDQYLLPFFDACSDCGSALREVLKLEEEFDRNRQKVLSIRNDSDFATPWQERTLFDSRKYYMALKSHNISYAQHYLYYQIDFCEKKLDSFNSSNSPKQPEIVKKRFSSKLSLHKEHLARLETGDDVYFDELLQMNEVQTREFISTRYPQIRTNERNT